MMGLQHLPGRPYSTSIKFKEHLFTNRILVVSTRETEASNAATDELNKKIGGPPWPRVARIDELNRRSPNERETYPTDKDNMFTSAQLLPMLT